MQDLEERLECWLKRRSYGDEKITSYVLKPINGKDIIDEINSSEVNTLEEIVMRITTSADGDARPQGPGRYRYVVYANTENGRVRGRLTFAINVESDDSDDVDEISEPPNSTGLLKQLMRHIEQVEKTHAYANTAIIGHLAKEVLEQRAYIKEMEIARMNNIATFEQNAIQATDNDIRMLEATTKQEILSKAVTNFLPLLNMALSTIANNIAGGGTSSGAPSPIETAVTAFVESLDPDEMRRIAGALPVEKQAVLFALADQIRRRDTNNGRE
jgi:hypothetical protein